MEIIFQQGEQANSQYLQAVKKTKQENVKDHGEKGQKQHKGRGVRGTNYQV